MPTTKEIRATWLKRAKLDLREAEDALLAERQREQDLRRAYGETHLVRNSALPTHLQKG
jgi:hypothetical protein